MMYNEPGSLPEIQAAVHGPTARLPRRSPVRLNALERMLTWLICMSLTLQSLALAGWYRSLTLPSSANPAVMSGGLVGEGKLEHFKRMELLARSRTAASCGVKAQHPAGEGVLLSTIGAMRAGSLYRNGADLIAPALTAAVEAITRDPATGWWEGLWMTNAKQALLFAIGHPQRAAGFPPLGVGTLFWLNQRQNQLIKRYPPSKGAAEQAHALGRNEILEGVKKHIYIYSPSGAVRDKAAFKRGVKRLQTLGHEVEVDEAALASHQRFAGDDSARLAALYRAAASGADVALMSRGGYGLSRLLTDINYKTITQAIEKGTQFAGFSDFTALQMALLASTGAVTWAGPTVCADFGAPEPDDIMEACFDDWVTGQGEGIGWQLPKPPRLAVATDVIAEEAMKAKESDTFDVKNALLWGGNLAMLASLVGTPYLPALPALKGGVLFIEDTGEHPYRIERMLTQLLHADVLAQQKAIIFGQFTHYQAVPHDKGFKLSVVVQWLQTRVKARVLTGLPFGHVATKVMLPVGHRVALAVEGRDAFVLWGHQHSPAQDHTHGRDRAH